MDRKELNEILENHKKWIMNTGGKRADLHGANLYCADLHEADLHGANLYCADLHDADLHYADLHDADLHDADLHGADLHGADLHDADLHDADLHGANLHDANLHGAALYGANLHYADLHDAKLYEADLHGANLHGAALYGANLRGATLYGADLYGASLRWATLKDAKGIYFPLRCPDTGAFVGWKKACGKIVKLLITEDAKRSSSTGNKCRCSKAVVLDIQSIDGKESFRSVPSEYNKNFVYKVGKTVEVNDFDENRWEECAPGIHFFITREEAVNYG